MFFGLADYVVVRSSRGQGNLIGADRVFGSVSRKQRKNGGGIIALFLHRTQKITSAKRPVDLTVRNDLTKKQTTTP